MSRVKIPACNPKLLALQVSNTDSKLSYGSTVTKAPKTSFVTTLSSARGPATTVGASVAPSRLPPTVIRAPPPTASVAQPSTRAAARSSTIDPTSVAGSSGSPTVSAATSAVSWSTKASKCSRTT